MSKRTIVLFALLLALAAPRGDHFLFCPKQLAALGRLQRVLQAGDQALDPETAVRVRDRLGLQAAVPRRGPTASFRFATTIS